MHVWIENALKEVNTVKSRRCDAEPTDIVDKVELNVIADSLSYCVLQTECNPKKFPKTKQIFGCTVGGLFSHKGHGGASHNLNKI